MGNEAKLLGLEDGRDKTVDEGAGAIGVNAADGVDADDDDDDCDGAAGFARLS